MQNVPGSIQNCVINAINAIFWIITRFHVKKEKKSVIHNEKVEIEGWGKKRKS